MNIVFYRKYRPNTFEQVVGQDEVIQTLKNSIENNKISHSYIFSGKHGTGKTTLAKIFAKVINNLVDVNNEEISKYNDIVEIDAASNNSVDDIRFITENILFSPSLLKYKVYIIDEVHMLSISAFNALLKTLEETPQHIVFLLATTEINKIPNTIISRCQCLYLKPIKENLIKKKLEDVCLKERIKIDDNSLNKLSRYSKGSLRDALNLLDQLATFGKNNIDDKKINDLIGFLDQHIYDLVFESIQEYNYKKIIEIINNNIFSGKQAQLFLENFLEYLIIKQIEDVNIENNDLLNIINILNNGLLSIKTVISENILIKSKLFECIQYLQCRKQNIIKTNKTNPKTNDVNINNKKNIINKIKDEKEEKEKQNNYEYVIAKEQEINILKLMIEIYKDNKKNKKDYFLDKIKSNLEIDDKVSMLLIDMDIKIADENFLVFVSKNKSTINVLNKYKTRCADIIRKIFNEEKEFVFITFEKWNIIRNYFLNQKNKKKIDNNFLEILNKKIKEKPKKKEYNAKKKIKDIQNFFDNDIIEYI